MNLGEIETEAREMFGFPSPASGGTDKLVQATVWKYINDALSNMVNAIDGIERYIEFTVATDWTLTVTVPASGKPTLTKTALAGGDHQAIKVSDLRTWGNLVNRTDGTGQPRSLRRVVYQERGWKQDQVSSQNYFDEFDIINQGLVLLPGSSQTNTISLNYRKVATAMTLTGDTPDSEIEAEYHNKYPVMYACKMLAIQKDDTRVNWFAGEAGGWDENRGEYVGMLGRFVDDYQLGDLGAESHSVENSAQSGEYFVRR